MYKVNECGCVISPECHYCCAHGMCTDPGKHMLSGWTVPDIEDGCKAHDWHATIDESWHYCYSFYNGMLYLRKRSKWSGKLTDRREEKNKRTMEYKKSDWDSEYVMRRIKELGGKLPRTGIKIHALR